MNDLNASYMNAMKELYGIEPSNVHNIDNTSYFYYYQELLLKLQSRFVFKNIPDTWDMDFLRDNLFTDGYLIALEKDGVPYLLDGGITGINVYNKPTQCNIANPVLGTFQTNIGVDSELLYFNRVCGFFRSARELVGRYAVLLAQCDASINTNLMNSRMAYMFMADNEAEAQTYKKMYDDVTSGKPAVFVVKKKDLNVDKNKSMVLLDVKSNYIANDIMDTKKTIVNEFLTEIGINNANTDKRERLVTSEVTANNTEVKSICSLWLDTMQECLERINKLFGLNVSVELNKEQEEAESAIIDPFGNKGGEQNYEL